MLALLACRWCPLGAMWGGLLVVGRRSVSVTCGTASCKSFCCSCSRAEGGLCATCVGMRGRDAPNFLGRPLAFAMRVPGAADAAPLAFANDPVFSTATTTSSGPDADSDDGLVNNFFSSAFSFLSAAPGLCTSHAPSPASSSSSPLTTRNCAMGVDVGLCVNKLTCQNVCGLSTRPP